jgi:peptide/nickel transport system substrate-binding protein
MSKKHFILLGLLVAVSMILAACATETAPETIVETVVVEGDVETIVETVVVETEGETIIETVIVEVAPEPTPVPPTERKGGWLDEVTMSIVSSASAVTQIVAGASDIYASNLSTPQDLAAIEEAGLERSDQFGLYFEITMNPVGPTFEGTGKLNPFSSRAIREAMNWLIDRDYINQEIYGGSAVPKFTSIVAGFPDYARNVETIRALEAKYAYDKEKAQTVISAEMEALGAVLTDGKWTYEGEPVELTFLIRTDSDGTRVPQGDYISNQLEDIGFTVTRQYGTSSELSPLWVGGNPNDGLWNLYTGAWGSGAISRDDGGDFQFFYTPQSAYAFSGLWQAYEVPPEVTEISEALANKDFTTLEERADLFAQAFPAFAELAYRVWVVDAKGFSPWRPGVEVAYDLSAGVDINALWPHTLRRTGVEGDVLRWGTPDLFVDPANGVAGSNWTYDSQWQLATNDFDTLNNPHTGVPIAQRLESAAVTVEEGLPVGKTYDWVSLEFAPTIEVPGDVWAGWDVENQVFLTADEVYTETQTAKAKVVYTYPADMFETVRWHDGSSLSVADFLMSMIMTFEPGSEGSAIFDDSQKAVLDSFLSTFKGFKLVSTAPLTFEYYTDTWYLDAEQIATPFRARFWPEYGYGNAPWQVIAISNLAEEAGELAYSGDKSSLAEIEWTNWIAGPSLDILKTYLDQAAAEGYLPYANTLGEYLTADEVAERYANTQAWYDQYGHFWIGTGPYLLRNVYPVEKVAVLGHNPDYVDKSDKWAIFSAPRLAEAAIDGPGIVAIGEEAVYDVFITYEGEPYPLADLDFVKYLLYGPDGTIVEVGSAEPVEDGLYRVTLSGETTGLLTAGSCKLEVAVVAIPVSIPAFSTIEFVAE